MEARRNSARSEPREDDLQRLQRQLRRPQDPSDPEWGGGGGGHGGGGQQLRDAGGRLLTQREKRRLAAGLPVPNGGAMSDVQLSPSVMPINREPLLSGVSRIPDIRELRGYPFSMNINPALTTVGGAFVGPFAGPGIFADFMVAVGSTQNAAADYDLGYRVDFSRNNELDAFTHVANLLPTGVSTADQTLFMNNTIRDYTIGTTDLSKPGWVSYRVYEIGSGMLFRDLNAPIMLDTFYVKVYIDKDGTGIAFKVNGLVYAR